jgi:hypothetical protein
MAYRVRKQLMEEDFAAVLSRKQRATPAVARIFDGEKEAKLIALACSIRPRDGHAGPCRCWRTRSWNWALSITDEYCIQELLNAAVYRVPKVVLHHNRRALNKNILKPHRF